MPVNDWPSSERPREKLLALGADALSEAELLAIFLRAGIPGKTCVDLARDLLKRFRGLRGILGASRHELCRIKGLGPATYAELQAILEIARRHLKETLERGPPLQHPRATRDFLKAHLRDLPHEVFACLYLDNRHRVIAFAEMFRGTIDGTSVYPREVVKAALSHNAAAIIFAHNHPSGIAEPSRADELITRRLKQALELVEIRVVDHFIVGDGDCVSLAERGLV